jgi:hypothetical protein
MTKVFSALAASVDGRSGGVVGQRFRGCGAGPPDRPELDHRRALFGEVERQPYERVHARWDLLSGPAALADHGDRPLPDVEVAVVQPEQRGGADP